ncbi:MAG TPA: VTT domain-containing protein [Terriglobales bacterium]|jgi:membrane protein DedA with SNARE-associated domain|nr:VTT domain-containing protein [Terriglobales bacterium]
MNHFFLLIAHHEYLFIFVVVMAEALGLPVPAALALVAGGAAAAAHTLSPLRAAVIALAAMLTGDTLLFILGRYMGWALLGLLCRLSVNPESCVLRSAESFYKRGKTTLLIAKFIPGVNTMAPPLAGSMRMPAQQFLRFDCAGASLYILAYGALGFLFHDFLAALTRGFQTASHVFGEVLFVAAVVYIAYRVWLYHKNKVYRVVPRVQVEELARKLQSEEKENVLILDVRSHGYYDANAERIRGSIRIEPNNLSEELKAIPKDKDIYLYCT